MMNVRPLLLSSIAAAALSLVAATPAVHTHRAGFMQMVHRLGLSDPQKAQIKTLVRQYRAQHPKGAAPDKAARKALREQVLTVLTPAQREQLLARLHATPAPLPEETAQP